MERTPMRMVLALWLTIASPAFATQDQWPTLFDVVGVAANDVLNIRAADTATSEIIGALDPDATGIEVIQPNEAQTWGLVNSGELHGWVSLSFLQRQPGQWLGAFPEIASCYGTEPFWGLSRKDGYLRFSGLDLPEMTAPITWESGTLNHRGRFAIVGGGMVGVIAMEACNDGMSDREFGIGITLADPSAQSLYQGCCSLAD